MSIIGTIGEASLVKSVSEATCSCKLAILRPKNISSEYLAAYLSSRIGKTLTDRWKRGAVQTGLLLEDMDQLPVARFTTKFEDTVKDYVDLGFLALEDSRLLQRDSEQTLLQALNLDRWIQPEALTYTRSSSDAFAAGRLDAEYFHPAKTAALDALQAQSHFTVGDLFDSVRELWQPDDWKPGTTVRNYDLSDALSPFLDASKQPTDVELIASTKR